jgi:hypothetical protein
MKRAVNTALINALFFEHSARLLGTDTAMVCSMSDFLTGTTAPDPAGMVQPGTGYASGSVRPSTSSFSELVDFQARLTNLSAVFHYRLERPGG